MNTELPGTEAAFLGNVPSDRLRERVASLAAQLWEATDRATKCNMRALTLQADLESTRDRFIRMEERHEAVSQTLREMRAERDRLVLANTEQVQTIADLEHALGRSLRLPNDWTTKVAEAFNQPASYFSAICDLISSWASPQGSPKDALDEMIYEATAAEDRAASGATAEPRTWSFGEDEPDVGEICDREGDTWIRPHQVRSSTPWRYYHKGLLVLRCSWHDLLARFGPVTGGDA